MTISKIYGDLDEWRDLPLHKLCSLFPEMIEEDYAGLVASMKTHGYIESDPIVLIDLTPDAVDSTWEILDGRNRQIAAVDADVLPTFVSYEGDDPVGFVTSKNLDRRHLTTGQKAAVASELANLQPSQNVEGSDAITQTAAAKKVGIGEATVRRYKYVEKHDPKLAAKVKSGEVPLEAARAAVKKDQDEGKSPVTEESNDTGTAKPLLGDNRAKKRAEEKEKMMAHINTLVSNIIETHEISNNTDTKSALIEMFTEGYTYAKQGN